MHLDTHQCRSSYNWGSLLSVCSFATLCVQMFFTSGLYAEKIENGEVLAKLRNYDNLYASALTVRGEITVPPPFNAPHLPSTIRSFVFSEMQERIGLIERTDEKRLDLRYRVSTGAGDHDLPGQSYDDSGNLIMSITTGRVVSFEPDRSGMLNINTVFVVTPNREVEYRPGSRSVVISNSDSGQVRTPINVVVWTIGRGYSDYIDEVTDVATREDGLLVVHGRGSFDHHVTGRWTLEINAQRQYLVRSANFVRDGDDAPFVVMTNMGISEDSSGTVFPNEGDCMIAGTPYHLQIARVSFQTNEATLAEARREIDDRSAGNTSVMDFTVSPPKSVFIDKSPSFVPPVLEEAVREKRSQWMLILIVVNVLVVIAVIAFRHWKPQ